MRFFKPFAPQSYIFLHFVPQQFLLAPPLVLSGFLLTYDIYFTQLYDVPLGMPVIVTLVFLNMFFVK
jgi:hypothetical protein